MRRPSPIPRRPDGAAVRRSRGRDVTVHCGHRHDDRHRATPAGPSGCGTRSRTPVSAHPPGGPRMRIRRTSVSGVLPDGLPVLAAGAHLAPEDGVCLMEYVSVLAGEPFSDSPRCTDGALAGLARLVNDEVSDEGRRLLAPLAADLTILGRTDAVGSARLVLAVTAHARTTAQPGRKLRLAERRAGLRLQRVDRPGVRGRLMRVSTPLHMRGAGRHRMVAAFDTVAGAPWATTSSGTRRWWTCSRSRCHPCAAAESGLLERTRPGGRGCPAEPVRPGADRLRPSVPRARGGQLRVRRGRRAADRDVHDAR